MQEYREHRIQVSLDLQLCSWKPKRSERLRISYWSTLSKRKISHDVQEYKISRFAYREHKDTALPRLTIRLHKNISKMEICRKPIDPHEADSFRSWKPDLNPLSTSDVFHIYF